jgi:hypothetical protein
MTEMYETGLGRQHVSPKGSQAMTLHCHCGENKMVIAKFSEVGFLCEMSVFENSEGWGHGSSGRVLA